MQSPTSIKNLFGLIFFGITIRLIRGDRHARDSVQQSSSVGLWDLQVGKDHSIKTFAYHSGEMDIWEGRNSGAKRYYVTPLAELSVESVVCHWSTVENRFRVDFDIHLWNEGIAEAAGWALAEAPLELEVASEQIHPLPVLRLRLVPGRRFDSRYEPETEWKSNLKMMRAKTFSIFTVNKADCDRLAEAIQSDADRFVTRINLEIALSAEKRASRTVTVTGAHIGNATFYTALKNMNTNGEKRFLTSNDLNKLSREASSQLIASEVTTDGFVPTTDQISLAELVQQELSKDVTDATDLQVEDWPSVFWQDDFARPDRYSSYLNSALKHDQEASSFAIDVAEERRAWDRLMSDVRSDRRNRHSSSAGGSSGGFFSSSSFDSHADSDRRLTTANVNDHAWSFGNATAKSHSEMEAFLRKTGTMVHWTGEKFAPKSFDLHRVNLADVRRRSSIVTDQIQIRSFPHTELLDVTVMP